LSPEVKAIAVNFGNDICKRNGSDKWELPVPGTFVIDTKGVVRFAQVDPDFMIERANPEAVLDIHLLPQPCPADGEIMCAIVSDSVSSLGNNAARKHR
jgi:hypothetical protein